MKRSGMPARTRPLRRRGGKARREAAALAVFRSAVKERSEGLCELADERMCGQHATHRGVHAHHVCPADRDRGVHDPERGLWVCVLGHANVHAHPEYAYQRGYLVRAS